MKKCIKEMVVLLIQLFMFYVFPLFAGPTDAMGMVFLIIFTFIFENIKISPSVRADGWGFPVICGFSASGQRSGHSRRHRWGRHPH